MKPILLCCLLLHTITMRAQLSTLDSGRSCSIRGMSLPADGSLWISGSNGMVARSRNAGQAWEWTRVDGFDSTDFRDIHAFDSLQAVIMGIGNPAFILRTRDGGRSWTQVFSKEAPGMFLDAMDFRGSEGICIGDPVAGGDGKRSFFVIRSSDSGAHWEQEPAGKLPDPAPGEAIFSASGSNIALLSDGRHDYAFITGGAVSRLHLVARAGSRSRSMPLPVIQGTESTGAFSMATDRRTTFYCAGGDYRNPGDTTQVFAFTTAPGNAWKRAARGPSGYRSCIIILPGGGLVACGTNGVDRCDAQGSWRPVSREGFNVCALSRDGRSVFLAGSRGRIAMLRL